jgi:hypothetical protein
MHATYPDHLTLPDLIIQTIFGRYASEILIYGDDSNGVNSHLSDITSKFCVIAILVVFEVPGTS